MLFGVKADGEDLPGARPNIVILYADDLGYGDLGCQNPESKIRTPNLDSLASEGVRFTDAHSSSGICTPSRYALLTGRYHWREFHDIVNTFDPPVFRPEQVTLAEFLRDQGYRTACIGKWHLGWDWNSIRNPAVEPVQGTNRRAIFDAIAFDWSKPVPGGPLDHGFDYYFGDDVPNFPPYCWIENDRIAAAPNTVLVETPRAAEGNYECRPGPMVEGWRFDAVMPSLTDRAVAWLRERKGEAQPFFLYFPFTSPHAPIVPTDEFIGSSGAGGFGDYVQQTDATVGRVIETLREIDELDHTLILFTSDNGPETYAFERLRKFDHSSPGPLRGLKRSIWEGGHRVPMIVRWPEHVPANQVCSRLISQIDIYATIAAVLGEEYPEETAVDSLDASSLFAVPDGPPIRRELVHNTHANQYALRSGQWLYIDVPNGDHNRVPDWYSQQRGYAPLAGNHGLFDLDEDLGQRTDLSTSHADVVDLLRKRLHELTRQSVERRTRRPQ